MDQNEMGAHSPDDAATCFVYGLQAASWTSGAILEPGMTKIGFTTRTVAERVKEMQQQLGAGGVHKLIVAFEVPVKDNRVERAVHAHLKSQGRHIAAGSAVEWFAIEPAEAREIVLSFAAGTMDIESTLSAAAQKAPAARNRSSIRHKEIKMSSARAEALREVRAAADQGQSRSSIAGGRWGAAAVALAVELDVSKDAALVLMREWFSD